MLAEQSNSNSLDVRTGTTQDGGDAGQLLIPARYVDPAVLATPSVYRGKRLLDIVGATLLLAFLSPLLILGLLVVLLTLGRPVLYLQDRVGRHGRIFRIAKLRTMRPETIEIDLTTDTIVLDNSEGDRTTWTTRLLRRASIDELPQLWNVIVGDMSLVGPRPETVSNVVDHEMLDHPRHLVNPGMTGLWQISEARNLEIYQGLTYDTDYVAEISLAQDLKILARTPGAVLRSDTH